MLYNQNDYGHVPYPAKGYEAATVKSGGCGVCCAATVLSFLGVDMPPEKLAPEFIRMGIRVTGGTDMNAAARYICDKAGVEYTTTSDEYVLAAHLRAGGVAIANVGGDRPGYTGLFSNGGHYITVLEARANGDFAVFDVGYYPGKYDSAYRAGKVKLEGNLQICSNAALHGDTLNRTPNYYLFKRKEQPKVEQNNTPSTWAAEAWEKAIKLGVTDGTNPQGPATREQLIVMLDRLGLLK